MSPTDQAVSTPPRVVGVGVVRHHDHGPFVRVHPDGRNQNSSKTSSSNHDDEPCARFFHHHHQNHHSIVVVVILVQFWNCRRHVRRKSQESTSLCGKSQLCWGVAWQKISRILWNRRVPWSMRAQVWTEWNGRSKGCAESCNTPHTHKRNQRYPHGMTRNSKDAHDGCP